MATSGYTNVTVTSWDTLQFAWSKQSHSVANNSTAIFWELKLVASSSGAINSSASKNWSVTINGQNFSGTNTVGISRNTTKILASGMANIPHNADGTKTFSYSFSQTFNITFSSTYIGTISGSGSGTLDIIPRQATLTYAPDFNDTQNPTINYTNPAGTSVTSLRACISWTGGDDIAYRDISKTGTSYTFTLTTAEKNALYAATSTSNSRQVVFYVQTVIGGVVYTSTLTKTFTVINANPTMNPAAEDYGTVSYTLTGDRNKIIRGFNVVHVAANATGMKGATIVSKSITCNGQSYTAGSTIAGFDGYFSYVESATFVFTVRDSRGNTATSTLNKTLINYIPVTRHITTSHEFVSGSSSQINLSVTISGKFFTGSFGATSNVLALKYRYKSGTGSYPASYTTVTSGIAYGTNEYSYTFTLSNIAYSSSLTVDVVTSDRVTGEQRLEYPIQIKPVFDWGADDFRFNVPVTCMEQVTFNETPIVSDHLTVYGDVYGDIYKGTGLQIGDTSMTDFVVEQGTKTATIVKNNVTLGTMTWSYRKWNSGIAECWGTSPAISVVSPGENNLSGYRYSGIVVFNHPASLFIGNTVSFIDGGPGDVIFTFRVFSTSKDYVYARTIGLSTPLSLIAVVHVHSCGRWK